MDLSQGCAIPCSEFPSLAPDNEGKDSTAKCECTSITLRTRHSPCIREDNRVSETHPGVTHALRQHASVPLQCNITVLPAIPIRVQDHHILTHYRFVDVANRTDDPLVEVQVALHHV